MSPPTNHLLTTYRLPTDYLPTTYPPPTDHLQTTYQPPTDHLHTTYQPPTNHLLTTYRPPTNHLQIITVQLVNYSCIPALLFNFISMITFADSEDEDFNPDNPNSDEDQDVKEE